MKETHSKTKTKLLFRRIELRVSTQQQSQCLVNANKNIVNIKEIVKFSKRKDIRGDQPWNDLDKKISDKDFTQLLKRYLVTLKGIRYRVDKKYV